MKPILVFLKHRSRAFFLLRLRWLRAYDILLSLERFFLGRKVRMEVCSKCQLACPSCSTAQGVNRAGVVGWGSLKPEDFRKFVAQNKGISRMEISNWGEIFLNPGLVEILQCAHEHGIAVEAGNGVNLNSASEEMLEGLVRYRVRFLSVSIDGATDETYRIYRKNGSLERVLHNVDRINHYKARYRSRYPRLQWQYVVFGHNEQEIAKARKMAAERGMRFKPIMNLDPDYSPVSDPGLVQIETGIKVETKQSKALGEIGRSFSWCGQLWDAPQINWDGKLLGCCLNNDSDFGNVFEQKLSEALAGESYVYAKKMLLGLAPPRPDIACTSCPVFRNMQG